MNTINKGHLLGVLSAPAAQPDIDLDGWLAALNQAMAAFQVDTPARQAAFLAQILQESGELRHLSENLHYSAPRLRQVWPKRFPSDELAAQYAHNPEKLANYVYAARLGNGNEVSGDGWRFRGRGLIQLTGRDNYSQFAAAVKHNVMGDPDCVARPECAALSAAWFWQARQLNDLADQLRGVNYREKFDQISQRVNGGTLGLEQRRAYWERAKQALQVS